MERMDEMTIQLLVRDGDPYWYLSPDIWVVPGNDPNGTPGNPIAGQPAYLWAQVANTGDTNADNVRVDFYWSNPALQVLRSNSTLIGSAFANIPAGRSQDVLCLVAWNPIIVNGGHECLIAVANHPGDSLPEPPPDDFNPPAYGEVAQKNLTVLAVSLHALSYAITIAAGRRADKSIEVIADIGGSLDKISLERLGIKNLRPAPDNVIEVGLDLERRCAGEDEPIGPNKLKLLVKRGTSTAVYTSIRTKRLEKGEYQLVRITERSGDQILGGYAFIVVLQEGRRQR